MSGLLRGVEAEEDPHPSGDEQGDYHDVGTDQNRPFHNSLDHVGAADADENAERAADGCHHDRLNDELKHDIAAAGADGHPNSDLAGPFGHGDKHDVHDADPTDEKRDRGDAAQENGHHRSAVGSGFSDVG